MWIDSFLEYLRLERNYSEKTAVSYGIDLREFEGYFKKADAENFEEAFIKLATGGEVL